MKIAICDNDLIIANYIKNLILKQKNKARVQIFSSGKNLLESNTFFDIYFLDIKGIDGLNIAKTLREKNIKSIVIFITGFAEYMSNAFDVQAFHYLLKPIDPNKFFEVLKNAYNEINSAKNYEEQYILIKTQNETKKLLIKDIFYIESAGKKVVAHTSTDIYETYVKMEDFEKILGDSFYRSHRCYLVNFEKISSYNRTEIKLTNGDKIMIAYKKYTSFVKAYLNYAKNGGIINV